MHAFKDCKGRSWELSITVGSLARLKGSVLGLDLTELALKDMKGVFELMQDGPRFVHAIYILVRASEQGCSEEDFADGFDGDTLLAADEAFREELTGFFRHPEEREALRRMLAKEMGFRRAMTDALTKRIDRFNLPEMIEAAEQRMDRSLESELRKLTSSSGPSPASSD